MTSPQPSNQSSENGNSDPISNPSLFAPPLSTEKKETHNKKFIALFIGGISINETEKDVLSVLEKIAKISYLKLIRKKGCTENKGFGFIHVSSMEEAEKINNSDIIINGKRAETYIAKSRREARNRVFSERNKKLFVGGLNPNTESKKLKELFQEFGSLLRAYVITDSTTKKSRCFGFLEFSDDSSAEKVLEKKNFKLDGHVIEVRSMLLKTEILDMQRGGKSPNPWGFGNKLLIVLNPNFWNFFIRKTIFFKT